MGAMSQNMPTRPAKAPTPAAVKQRSILGFFQKQDVQQPTNVKRRDASPVANGLVDLASSSPSMDGNARPSSPTKSERAFSDRTSELTQTSPMTPISINGLNVGETSSKRMKRSAERDTKTPINYAESDSDIDVYPSSNSVPTKESRERPHKRQKIAKDADTEFVATDVLSSSSGEEGSAYSDDAKAASESDDDVVVHTRRTKNVKSSPTPIAKLEKIPTEDLDIPDVSTARQWTFDPENPGELPDEARHHRPTKSNPTKKPKAHAIEPEKRYPWLANIRDADRHGPDHPDFDPRTIYVPPLAWTNFSPFEKQYWEIKQNFWDTIVFFKKGKFYELYENDATIGHQLFDLKLTDRVNMRMVGVPEASLEYWASQFVAKGFKIARVDQMESALAKEMRERDGDGKTPKKSQKEDKVIRRELASVLTGGTLVDGAMLSNDMSTFCAAVKEGESEGLPAFGVAFVDTSTAQFHLVEFVDDADMTKFETLAAQIRPGELILEKSCISSRALRILKANTGLMTIWNLLKPIKEFWPTDITVRELEASSYFESSSGLQNNGWPVALHAARNKDLLMSAFGALTHYLRTLKIDRDLISLGNISQYDPIRHGTSLVLDGQSLTNLEIFANTYDGGTEGTLFSILNRCVTPFGKRMLRQWLCHPLIDPAKINARLDAVESLMANTSFTDRFTSSLTKLPDLERLISRIHAKRCKPIDFIKVLDGFEQIEYTISLLAEHGDGPGIIGELVKSMPDLQSLLKEWENAFDKKIARDTGVLVPEPGIEQDFDAAKREIIDCEAKLAELLIQAKAQLCSSAICYRDNGKEIYQLEVPLAAVKRVPQSWDQMSATAKVRRYYSPELRKLVRKLQEAHESHAQVVKEVAGRFYTRFDKNYSAWLAAVRVVAQLDCLTSLASASSSLGAPSCRPVLIDEDTACPTVQFTDLRHPTMLTSVSTFIPNDISLGGGSPNLALLTGANAAGKSTVLRMTCVAVILAQVGCYVPASAARLTPCDRIMSRLGANDNIMQQQSTFFVELAETKKMLCEATTRSLVILDELGRGTSSLDGLAVAEATLHHIAGDIGCVGFFATHYHAVAHEFAEHPEIAAMRMAIEVDNVARNITFLYKLEPGIAEGSFGMHCASMCGINASVVERAEKAADTWEHSGRVQERIEKERGEGRMRLGWCSDVAWTLSEDPNDTISDHALEVLRRAIENM